METRQKNKGRKWTESCRRFFSSFYDFSLSSFASAHPGVSSPPSNRSAHLIISFSLPSPLCLCRGHHKAGWHPLKTRNYRMARHKIVKSVKKWKTSKSGPAKHALFFPQDDALFPSSLFFNSLFSRITWRVKKKWKQFKKKKQKKWNSVFPSFFMA